MTRWIALLFCRLGLHGPDWFGWGAGVGSPRNQSVAPGHRRCGHCGAEWVVYERVTNHPMRSIGWEKIK